jgi:hypothetical protein
LGTAQLVGTAVVMVAVYEVEELADALDNESCPFEIVSDRLVAASRLCFGLWRYARFKAPCLPYPVFRETVPIPLRLRA